MLFKLFRFYKGININIELIFNLTAKLIKSWAQTDSVIEFKIQIPNRLRKSLKFHVDVNSDNI